MKYAPAAPLSVIKESPLKIWELAEDVRNEAVVAYVKSLKIVFIIGVPVRPFPSSRTSIFLLHFPSSSLGPDFRFFRQFYVLSLLAALLIKNISIKPPAKKGDDEAASPVAREEQGIAEGETARAEGA